MTPNDTPMILSVHPNFAWNIKFGKKKIELRKSDLPWQTSTYELRRIFIYATAPVQKVICECVMKNIDRIQIPPKAILNAACINEEEFYEYRGKNAYLVAHEISSVRNLDRQYSIEEFGLTKAPQSYAYAKKIPEALQCR